ncbi:MAG: hypothetical protein HFJ53_08550 [Clostridia bacterium]|jgi:stage III sporulation protein AG|nr:hypothetical protein [Clostridia bacterium]
MLKKIQTLISKESEKSSKKKIENIVVFIIILVITVIAINTIWKSENNTQSVKEDKMDYTKQLASANIEKKEETLTDVSIERNIEEILSKMEGIGDVKVLITYSQTSEVVAMYNENSKNSSIEEKDTGGGTRSTQQQDTNKEIIYKEENGQKVPITQKVINPKPEGAIITAVGANNAATKNNIIQAVEAVTGLPTHKIQVFEMKK